MLVDNECKHLILIFAFIFRLNDFQNWMYYVGWLKFQASIVNFMFLHKNFIIIINLTKCISKKTFLSKYIINSFICSLFSWFWGCTLNLMKKPEHVTKAFYWKSTKVTELFQFLCQLQSLTWNGGWRRSPWSGS